MTKTKRADEPANDARRQAIHRQTSNDRGIVQSILVLPLFALVSILNRNEGVGDAARARLIRAARTWRFSAPGATSKLAIVSNRLILMRLRSGGLECM